MPSPLSIDLRERVVAFCAAASRFGVSAASASRWSRRLRQDGQLAPKPLGGGRVSHRMEAHARLILATCRREPTLFLRELRRHHH
jgi:transposase